MRSSLPVHVKSFDEWEGVCVCVFQCVSVTLVKAAKMALEYFRIIGRYHDQWLSLFDFC